MNNKIDEFFEKDTGKSKAQRWTDADNSRLNVVYIHTHDTGRMIGPYDDRFDTPALNRLAADGTVLDHLYCVGPTCSPSRSGLLTGRMPHQNGMLGLAHRGFSIYDMDQHFCRFIGRQGYETALCGMQHEVHDPALIGYDHVSICSRPEAEDLTAWDSENADAACSFIRNEHTDPFFLSYGLVHTHRPFLELDEDIVVDDNDVPACLPITAMVKQDMARFITSVRRADECIGRVLDALEEQKLLDHTIVFYTTDHGPAFPFMKCTLTEGGTGVSGIIHIPGNVRAGQHIEAMLSHLDFYPTLCDLLQIPKPDWLEGKSFAGLLLGSSEKDSVAAVNQAVFSEINYHAAYEPQRSVRNQRYRLIVRYDDLRQASPDHGFPAEKPRLANIDEGLAKISLKEEQYICSDGSIDQNELLLSISNSRNTDGISSPCCASFRYAEKLLFDLWQDPDELCNLADDPDHAGILKELETLLVEWQIKTKDPILADGYIIAPSPSTVNRQTCYDPDSKDVNDYE